MNKQTRILAALLVSAGGLLAADAKPAPKIDDPRTVTVGERAVVAVYVCQFQETLVILPASEKVMKSFVADSANWKLESGRDDQASRYISIKVKEPQSPQTTLNVVSDHDSNYTFRLVLNDQHCDSKVSIDADSQLAESIRHTEPWVSPGEFARLKMQVDQEKTAAEEAKKKAEQSADSFRAAYPAKLHFDYKWDAKAAERLGVHSIWHDDKFTYISANPEETPALFEVKQGKPSLIAFEFADGVYWTGRILDEGYLAVGGNGDGKHQQKLEFKRVAKAEETN